MAWNLAGGYQHDMLGEIRPVLDIHDNTMAECGADVSIIRDRRPIACAIHSSPFISAPLTKVPIGWSIPLPLPCRRGYAKRGHA